MSEFTVSKSDQGVFNVVESAFDHEGYGYTVSDRNYILIEESEFDFELYKFNNGIGRKAGQSFQLYDVNGKTAVLCEFKDQLITEGFPAHVIRYMAQSLVHSKYPAIDCNAFHVGITWHANMTKTLTVIIGSQSAVVEFENGY